VAENDESQAEGDDGDFSRKKVALKQTLVTAAAQKRRALAEGDIVAERISESSALSRLLSHPAGRRLGNVTVSDRDPRDRVVEYDRDASDPFHYTDMDPTDSVGYPSDIILTDPF
jgi:hypothetical protein